MKGVCLTFYTYELQKDHRLLMYEWLLEIARKQGIHGGSAYRAIAGFGRHGVLHEEHFFELASNVPVKIEFILSREEIEKLLQAVKLEKANLVYTISEVEFGTTN